jgi:hypothetical protein
VYENGALRPASPSTKHDDVKPSSPEVNRLLIDRQKAGVCLNFVYLDEPSTIATLQSPMILPTLDKVKEELPNCSDFKDILSYLIHGCLPENDQAARRVVMESKDFLLEDGVLYHLYTPRTHNLDRSATWVKQLCIPSSLRPAVAVALHDSNNHCGFDRTYATCRSRFFSHKCTNFSMITFKRVKPVKESNVRILVPQFRQFQCRYQDHSVGGWQICMDRFQQVQLQVTLTNPVVFLTGMC